MPSVLKVYEATIVDTDNETVLFCDNIVARDREQAMVKLDRAVAKEGVKGSEGGPLDITNTWYVKVLLREIGSVTVD